MAAIHLLLVLIGVAASPCMAAEVVVIGDTRLKPVVEIVAGIRKGVDASVKTFSPAEVKGKLKGVVDAEGAKVVVALGKEAIYDALLLPSSIPVIYDLVVTPPQVNRANTTGFYMATPVREYSNLIRNHLHSIRKMAVVGSHDQLTILGKDEQQISSYTARNPFEFVNIVKQLDAADAILLLPDVSLLTSTAMEEAYLLSFRKKIPLLGISERHVKEGALFALVVDPASVGRQIGEYAARALKGGGIGQIPPSPAKKFELYLNAGTAKKMGIQLPDEMLRMAKRVYP